MKKYSYYREQLNILTQFTAAFDDVFLYRYTKDNIAKEKIAVRYVMGPKHRVLYDIINQNKNITLPVISLEQINIKRDSSRIQFKDQKITRPNPDNSSVVKVPSPIPITMDVNVSIIANYKEDIDQIVSNFLPWCNPYFIISWKIPEEFGMDYVDELRTEVTWSGSVDFENPLNISNEDKYRIVGNTSFNLKGWIFPSIETPQAPIYVINSNFNAISTQINLQSYNVYSNLSSYNSTDVIMISAYPEISNSFYNGMPFYNDITINSLNNNTFTFYGKRFGFNNNWYLSGDQVVPSLIFEEIETIKFPSISAYRLPSSLVTLVNDNIVSINLSSSYLELGSFTFVTSNSAGWVSSESVISVVE